MDSKLLELTTNSQFITWLALQRSKSQQTTTAAQQSKILVDFSEFENKIPEPAWGIEPCEVSIALAIAWANKNLHKQSFRHIMLTIALEQVPKLILQKMVNIGRDQLPLGTFVLTPENFWDVAAALDPNLLVQLKDEPNLLNEVQTTAAAVKAMAIADEVPQMKWMTMAANDCLDCLITCDLITFGSLYAHRIDQLLPVSDFLVKIVREAGEKAPWLRPILTTLSGKEGVVK